MLIIRGSKLYYTASGIITHVGDRPGQRLREDSLYASTCFEHYVLIITRSKLYYTASDIITLCRWPSRAKVERGLSQPVHRTATYGCDDTRCCIIQFNLLMMSTIVLETCRGTERVLSQPLPRTVTYMCDDTRCCIIQFNLLMMSTIVLETCRGTERVLSQPLPRTVTYRYDDTRCCITQI